jgi:cyclic pyranopterin phosphate synthase
MVDVGKKPMTRRVGIASGQIRLLPETLVLIRDRGVQKGDVLEIARVAGVMATKRTSDLIPLCHPLRLDSVEIGFEFPDESTINIVAKVAATERTGVEMEALTAVSVAALTIYDMCKSVDREIQISNIQLEQKSGGKSGMFKRRDI